MPSLPRLIASIPTRVSVLPTALAISSRVSLRVRCRTTPIGVLINKRSFSASLSTFSASDSTSNVTSNTSPRQKACPKCSSLLPLSSSPCPSCGCLVPIPSEMDAFTIFNLSPSSDSGKSGGELSASTPDPKSPDEWAAYLSHLPDGGFGIDVRELRGRFLKRQQGVHPDSYSGAGDAIQGLAIQQSGQLNKAYSTLVDPLSRAQHLLELYGKPVEETDSLTDPILLMEILEARESLEEAQTASEMEAVRASNSEKTEHTLKGLAEAFGKSPPDLERAKALCVELQYLRNLENAAKDWAPGKRVEIKH